MFTAGNRFINKPKTKQVYRLGALLPVLTSEQLLMTKEVRSFTHEIQAQVQLPQAYFDVLYQHVLEQFATMVQLLPFDEDGVLGGLFNRGIARATLALRHYTLQYSDDQDPLEAYAIFTAALLLEVGKLLNNYSVVLFAKEDDSDSDSNGVEWQPLLGPMQGNDTFYKIFPKIAIAQDLEHEVTAILAEKQFMPKEGFLWIASDSALFYDWLLVLRNAETVSSRRISHILSLVKHDELQDLLGMLGQPHVDMLVDANTEHADKFYRWLRDGLDTGVIKLNANGLVFVDNMLYAEYEFLQTYIATQKITCSAEQLRVGVERLFRFMSKENHQNKQFNANKTAVSFLNHKKIHAVSGVPLPVDLILRRDLATKKNLLQQNTLRGRPLPRLVNKIQAAKIPQLK